MAEILTYVDKIENVLLEVLSAEWKAQGHEMNGAIVRDMEFKINHKEDTLTISGYIYPYGNIIARGIKPGKVPFNWTTARRGQGKGGTSDYIEGLKNYAKVRMAITDDKEALSTAFAIAKTQKLEGMPTYNSYKFSMTGQRMDWIEEALKKGGDRITDAAREIAYDLVSVKFDAIIKQWQYELNNQ